MLLLLHMFIVVDLYLRNTPHDLLEKKTSSGWWLSQPLWKIWVRQLGWWNSQSMESHKSHVPDHQPDKYLTHIAGDTWSCWWATAGPIQKHGTYDQQDYEPYTVGCPAWISSAKAAWSIATWIWINLALSVWWFNQSLLQTWWLITIFSILWPFWG